MSEEVTEVWRALGDHRKALRAKYGVNCPVCVTERPKAHPTILLPQQRCRIHDYRDPRPELTDEQYQAVGDSSGNTFESSGELNEGR